MTNNYANARSRTPPAVSAFGVTTVLASTTIERDAARLAPVVYPLFRRASADSATAGPPETYVRSVASRARTGRP